MHREKLAKNIAANSLHPLNPEEHTFERRVYIKHIQLLTT